MFVPSMFVTKQINKLNKSTNNNTVHFRGENVPYFFMHLQANKGFASMSLRNISKKRTMPDGKEIFKDVEAAALIEASYNRGLAKDESNFTRVVFSRYSSDEKGKLVVNQTITDAIMQEMMLKEEEIADYLEFAQHNLTFKFEVGDAEFFMDGKEIDREDINEKCKEAQALHLEFSGFSDTPSISDKKEEMSFYLTGVKVMMVSKRTYSNLEIDSEDEKLAGFIAKNTKSEKKLVSKAAKKVTGEELRAKFNSKYKAYIPEGAGEVDMLNQETARANLLAALTGAITEKKEEKKELKSLNKGSFNQEEPSNTEQEPIEEITEEFPVEEEIIEEYPVEEEEVTTEENNTDEEDLEEFSIGG